MHWQFGSTHSSTPENMDWQPDILWPVTPHRRVSSLAYGKGQQARLEDSHSSKLTSITEDPVLKDAQRSTTKTSSVAGESMLETLRRKKGSAAATPQAQNLVQCLVCVEDIASTRATKLECGHWWCNNCLKQPFERSVTDQELMPPKCCSTDPISFELVKKLFDTKFQQIWKLKYEEHLDESPIYCPRRHCRTEYIQARHTQVRGRHKYRKCPTCSAEVCVLCKTEHQAGTCPTDPEGVKFRELAKKEGWQTCYRCQAIVERVAGCNHMTCRCHAEFCAKCGARWEHGSSVNRCRCPIYDPGYEHDAHWFENPAGVGVLPGQHPPFVPPPPWPEMWLDPANAPDHQIEHPGGWAAPPHGDAWINGFAGVHIWRPPPQHNHVPPANGIPPHAQERRPQPGRHDFMHNPIGFPMGFQEPPHQHAPPRNRTPPGANERRRQQERIDAEIAAEIAAQDIEEEELRVLERRQWLGMYAGQHHMAPAGAETHNHFGDPDMTNAFADDRNDWIEVGRGVTAGGAQQHPMAPQQHHHDRHAWGWQNPGIPFNGRGRFPAVGDLQVPPFAPPSNRHRRSRRGDRRRDGFNDDWDGR